MREQKGFWGLCIIFSFILFKSVICSAMDIEHTRTSLRGLNKLYVVIEKLPSELQKEGLHVGQIRTDVELKLRMVGINVLDESTAKIQASPYLAVAVNSSKDNTSSFDFYLYNIEVKLSQLVYLERDPTIFMYADTWSYFSYGRQQVGRFRDIIKDLTDRFINAYLSVNPKRE